MTGLVGDGAGHWGRVGEDQNDVVGAVGLKLKLKLGVGLAALLLPQESDGLGAGTLLLLVKPPLQLVDDFPTLIVMASFDALHTFTLNLPERSENSWPTERLPCTVVFLSTPRETMTS